MSISHYEASGEVGSGSAVAAGSSRLGTSVQGERGSVISAPICLEEEELRSVAELETPTSRFYVGNRGLCLVEAVEISQSSKIDLDGVLERVERKLIKFALEKTGGARAGAARLMGISRSRLYRRLHALGLDDIAEDEGNGSHSVSHTDHQ
jgi:hypothetical protein